jgi:hypothetical protein
MDRPSRCPTCRHSHRQSAIAGYDPRRTRTCNQLIKSQLLCQIELVGPTARPILPHRSCLSMQPAPPGP